MSLRIRRFPRDIRRMISKPFGIPWRHGTNRSSSWHRSVPLLSFHPLCFTTSVPLLAGGTRTPLGQPARRGRPTARGDSEGLRRNGGRSDAESNAPAVRGKLGQPVGLRSPQVVVRDANGIKEALRRRAHGCADWRSGAWPHHKSLRNSARALASSRTKRRRINRGRAMVSSK